MGEKRKLMTSDMCRVFTSRFQAKDRSNWIWIQA